MLKKYNVIDIETDGLELEDAINWIGILTFDSDDDPGDYIILDRHSDNLDILNELKGCINIFHNGKFDTKMIKHQLGVDIKMDHDTLILAYISSQAFMQGVSRFFASKRKTRRALRRKSFGKRY